MKKKKAKDGIVVNAGNGNYIPNIVRGGAAIPIGKKNFYYMQGRKHEQGGIDVGRNPKTGLEVEGEEVMQVTPNEVRVYSSVPFLRGVSPAELVLNGADANKVFAAQEKYKDNNRINDDGTKYRTGGNINKNISTNQNDFLDSWNTARLATGRYNNQLGDGRLERQAKSRNTAREFHSPVGFAMNYGKQATIRTPSMSDIDYRKEIARNAQNMKLRLNNPETGQGVIGGAYHAPTHSSYINQEEYAKDPTVRTHENAHASKAAEQEQTISNIIGSNDKSDYLRRPTEIYSRLMQFRQANNIDPNTVYDKNSFKELKKNAIDYNLINTFKDEEVIDLLNNVAMNNDPNKINLNNYNLNNVPAYMAKYGTKQKYNEKNNTKYIDAEIALPEIIVTPENWQKDFIDNFANKEFRNRIYSDLRHNVPRENYNVALENIYNNTPKDLNRKEINKRHNELIKNAKDKFKIEENDNYINIDNHLKRLYTIWNDAGRPKVNIGKGRPYFNPITNSVNNINNIHNLNAELSHPIQYKYGLRNKWYNYLVDFPKTVYGELTGNYKHYKDNYHYEGETHNYIEPILNDYLYKNSNTYNNLKLNKKQYGGTKNINMGKLVSINGNVKNGLIHTPNQDVLAYNKERKPRFNGRYSKPGLHNLELLVADLILPKGKVNIEPDVPKRLGWVEAHNRLVGADISQKPLDAKKDNTNVAHTISETERRTRKFVCGGRSKAKVGTKKDNVIDEIVINAARPKLSAYSVLKDNDTSNRHSKKVIEREVYQADALSSDRLKTKIDNTPYKEKEIDTSYGDKIVTPLINSKSVSKAERNANIRGRINNEYNSVEELLNRVRELGTDAQDKSNKDYIPYSSPVDNYGEKTFRNNITLDRLNRFGITPHTYGNGERTISNTSINDNQDIIENTNNGTPRKETNQSSSSSTGGVNNKTSKPTKSAVQRVNRLAPATNAEMAGIRRGLEPLLQNTVVDKLNKNVDNDLNIIPAQTDIAKTRNMDNILLGVNLGSSVLDAVMGNIYANQMHGYTAPTITAPTISNPGEIKLNEEDLKDIPAPILMAAAKLKTRYNANPQLSKIEDETRRIMGEIDRNTSNSRVALARKQRAALQGQQAKNEVYGRKENIETELINKDKLNQQEVTARNLARYDQYNQALAAQRANRARLRLAADTANIQNKLAVNTANAQLKSQADRFNTTNRINQLVHQAGIDAAKAETRSNIFSSMLGNIGSALNTWNRNKRQAKLDEETLRVLGLRAPNANKLVLSALGY